MRRALSVLIAGAALVLGTTGQALVAHPEMVLSAQVSDVDEATGPADDSAGWEGWQSIGEGSPVLLEPEQLSSEE